jgi:uncharacterized protein (TIGR03067 family)
VPDDLDKLQGTWNVISLEADGQEVPAAGLDGSVIVIKGDRFTSLGMGATYEGTIALDPAKKPKTFDLVCTAGHAAGTRNRGIYKLADGTWTISLATRGGRRPATFATRPDTGFALQTLTRGGAARKTAKKTSQPERAIWSPGPAGRARVRASLARHVDAAELPLTLQDRQIPLV